MSQNDQCQCGETGQDCHHCHGNCEAEGSAGGVYHFNQDGTAARYRLCRDCMATRD